MSDIEDFLRKAAQRRKEKKRKAPPPPEPAAPVAPLQSTPMPSLPSSLPPQPEPPAAQHQMLRTRHAVENSVEQHIDTTSFESQTSEIGHEIGMADDRMEARLHDKFDHSLGSLVDTGESPKLRRRETHSLIANMFANPQNIRQAFIMSEIMRPVADRDDHLK